MRQTPSRAVWSNGKRLKGMDAGTRVGIRHWWLILLSAALHRIPFAVFGPQEMVDLKRTAMVASYLLLLLAFVCNLNLKSIRVMLAGTAMNFTAILANGGLMPVSPEIRHLAAFNPLGPEWIGRVLPDGSGILLPAHQTNLLLLTDVIPAARLGGAYSAGDVLIIAGFFLLITEVFLAYRDTRRKSPAQDGERENRRTPEFGTDANASPVS